MIDLPPTSAWFFFVLHLLAGMTHLVSVLMTVSPIGKRAGLRVSTRIAGIMAHGGGAALHFLIGLNSFFGLSLRNPDNTVPFHSMFIIVMIAIGLPTYLYLAQADVLIQAEKKARSRLRMAGVPVVPGEPVIPMLVDGSTAATPSEETSTNEGGPPHSFPYEPGNPEGTTR